MTDMAVAANAAAESKGRPKAKGSRPFTPRPNFAKIHAKPLPVEVYPLPAFVPHNPLSVLRIVYILLSHYIFPPSSHPPTHHSAVFSSETSSVVVDDEKSIRALWESGFFGKGSLSRSEPNWLAQERKRRGLDGGLTSEMFTQKRRQERIDMKNERARLQREAVEEQLRAERAAAGSGMASKQDVNAAPNGQPPTKSDSTMSITGDDVVLPASEGSPPLLNGKSAETGVSNINTSTASIQKLLPDQIDQDAIHIDDQEHLQLSFEEAFFLVYALGVLQIRTTDDTAVLEAAQLLQLFRRHTYSPSKGSSELQPDDPFLINYVVYHHFRSLGWVIRPGNKFSVDFLLYKGGPVFSHAEFAVIIVPSYVNEWWFATPERRARVDAKRKQQPWWWVQNTNRVQTQVLKTLVMVYVEVPAPGTVDALESDGNVGGMLKQYRVREFVMKRWTPNRQRE